MWGSTQINFLWPASEKSLNWILACRYSQEETYENDMVTRNKCSSDNAGISVLGIKAGTSSSKCKNFASNSKNWESTAVKRFESSSYGVFPNKVYMNSDSKQNGQNSFSWIHQFCQFVNFQKSRKSYFPAFLWISLDRIILGQSPIYIVTTE